MDADRPDAHADDERLARLARASSLALEAGEYADVPAEVEDRVRVICRRLPEITENPAWAGTQWRVRKRTFAHVLAVDFPDGPTTVLTFRAAGPDLEALRGSGLPYFRPAWGNDAVGRVLDLTAGVDWDEVAELVADSYCTVAPRKLVAVVRAAGPDGR